MMQAWKDTTCNVSHSRGVVLPGNEQHTAELADELLYDSTISARISKNPHPIASSLPLSILQQLLERKGKTMWEPIKEASDGRKDDPPSLTDSLIPFQDYQSSTVDRPKREVGE